MEFLEKSPIYTVKKESLGRHRKYWGVRENFGDKRIATVMATKAEASTWVMVKEVK